MGLSVMNIDTETEPELPSLRRVAFWPMTVFGVLLAFGIGLYVGQIAGERSAEVSDEQTEAMAAAIAQSIHNNPEFKESAIEAAEDRLDRPRYNGDPPRSISVRPGQIVLVRGGSHLGAFRITEGYGPASYESWYWPQSPDQPNPAAAQTATGKLHENAGELDVVVGPLRVEWSTGNHLYPHPHSSTEDPSAIEITATPWTDIDELDLTSGELRWIQ